MVLLGIAAVGKLTAAGIHDPEFDKVPFDQWLAPHDSQPSRRVKNGDVSGGAQWKWSERTLPLLLSVHQRLMARVQIQLDGAEAARRKGEGALIFYFQVTDAAGVIYQDHTSYDLTKVEEGMRSQDLSLTESVFALPGDYAVSLAIYDTATKEHSAKLTKLHIAPLKLDPLPEAWKNLPPIEFVESSEGPDHWFLPKEVGKLNLPVTPKRPLRLDVLVNLTPTQEGSRTYGIQDRNLSFMIPSLKVISEITAPGLKLNIGLLDLSRRRMTFRQDNVHTLDWDKMKASLSEANSGSIDVKSLADRQHNAAFFASEITRRLVPGETSPGDAGPTHVVIVLSGPMVFDAGQEFPDPLSKPSSSSRFFYIRITIPRERVLFPGPDMNRHHGMGGGFPGRSRIPPDGETTASSQIDQLEPLLKPLDPHLFDVMTAEQFRKALATIMSELSN